jgi:hypothetical protein
LTGTNAAHLSAVSNTPRTGFETTIATTAAPFVQVRALSASGKTLGTSKTVAPTSA